MNDRPVMSGRLFFGLIVLALGTLWTLDNLGWLDASKILRWWPLIALTWGVMRLTGIGVTRRTARGAFWTIVGGLTLLNTLGLLQATIFDLWPVFLIVIGGSIVYRAWRGASWNAVGNEAGARLSTFAFMAGSDRKVVAQDFRGGDVSAVMGGATVDLRAARLADGRAEIDVFAMWGGVELIVPPGWRVVGEVTPVLGGFQDSTAPPEDPAAPTLIVRGLVVMGGVEVKHEAGTRVRVITSMGARDAANVRGFAGVGFGIRSADEGGVKEIRVGRGGVTVRREVWPAATADTPAGSRVKDEEIRIGPEGVTVRKQTRPDAPDAPAGAPPENRPVDPE